MAQTRHLTPVGHIVKVEDAIHKKTFQVAYKLTTPLATVASILFFAFLLLIIGMIIWVLYSFVTFPFHRL